MRKHAIALAASVAALAAPAYANTQGHEYGPGVQWQRYLERAAPQYVTAQRIEVRSDPEAEGRITAILRRGEVVEAAGQTGDGWVAVARDGVIIGFVPDDLVAAVG
jgi:hypothetical protein